MAERLFEQSRHRVVEPAQAPDIAHLAGIEAYDSFRTTAGLWTRLNCDSAYVQSEIHPSASLEMGFPDNDANTEPSDWLAHAESWGFASRLAGQMTAQTIPPAGIAEMADRVQFGRWDPNLNEDLRQDI